VFNLVVMVLNAVIRSVETKQLKMIGLESTALQLSRAKADGLENPQNPLNKVSNKFTADHPMSTSGIDIGVTERMSF